MEIEFEAYFTSKDAISFAVSLGYGSSSVFYNDELRYVWEEDDNFEVVPTFAFALAFWARRKREKDHNAKQEELTTTTTFVSLPPFPPPMMEQMGFLPRECLLVDDIISWKDYPVLHTRQSITWHSSWPKIHARNQVGCCNLSVRFLSVRPKSLGTFVTTETLVSDPSSRMPICTMKSTVLLLGLDDTLVKPVMFVGEEVSLEQESKNKQSEKFLVLEKDFVVAENQALLYRLASGDSNPIHVNPSEFFQSLLGEKDGGNQNKPILHGLATLGMAARVLEHEWFIAKQTTTATAANVSNSTVNNDGKALDWIQLEASFRKPVFMGETLHIRAWQYDGQPSPTDLIVLFFQVTKRVGSNESKEVIVLDQCVAKVKPKKILNNNNYTARL